jgi:hypothetical protein
MTLAGSDAPSARRRSRVLPGVHEHKHLPTGFDYLGEAAAVGGATFRQRVPAR